MDDARPQSIHNPAAPPSDHAAVAPGEHERGAAFADTVAADLVVTVAPTTGRFRPAPARGPLLRPGDLLGHVTGGGGRADEVRCPVNAVVRALLVRPGQLVSQGQAIAWLDRRGEHQARRASVSRAPAEEGVA